MSYIFAVLFTFLTFYISKKIYKEIGTTKPLHRQIQDYDDCYRCLFKNAQVVIDNVALYYSIYSRNLFHNYVHHITICMESGSNEFFEIRKKTIAEKLLMKFSFLKSHKGNNTYPNNLHIASDNPELYQRLDTNLLHKIEAIFNTQAPFQYKYLKLYNQNGELCLKFFLSTYFTWHKKLKIDEIEIDKTIKNYDKKLIEIAQDFQLANLKNDHSFERTKEKVSWIKYLIVSSALGSFFMMIYYSFQVFPQTIDTFRLLNFAVILSSFLALFTYITVIATLKESAFKHKIALQYAFFLFVSTITISGYTIRCFNVTFDNSIEKIVYRKVTDKTYGLKGHKNYHLKFPYAYAQSITSDDVKVPYDLYKNIRIGESVKIMIKNGYFHIRYIDNIIGVTHNKS